MGKFSATSRIRSFKYALRGIGFVLRSEHNAWIHILVALIVSAAGIAVHLSSLEWCCIVISISVVLAAEAFNTALEQLTNLVSPDFHPLAGKTKDIAAGGVLITALGAATVGIIVFLPHVFSAIRR
jgi:diacylglycerol kinase (ATP)